MTGKDAQQYSIATIRQLLLAAFTPEELRRFCYDRPTFRPIVDLFGPGLGAVDMVDRVVEYCDRNLLLDELLAELKKHNPPQYARFIKPEPSEKEPAPSTPEILTISHPVSLLLVRVPAGEFQMGSVMARDKDTQDDELPPHTVHVPDFYMSKYPVTNLQYQAFIQASGHRAPRDWERGPRPQGKENHPVPKVSWRDALAFCNWLSQETGHSFHLPTEVEWEKAARGTDGRIYPWGDEPPDEARCNFGENVGDTTTIGRYSPQGDSPYGCADMAGNVVEWCHSHHRPYPYHAGDGREDFEKEDGRWYFTEALDVRVLRGGAWWSSAQDVRCASRPKIGPFFWPIHAGFRVAKGPLP
jgi:formylglycine-generating enzyme required for sulfatase activity